MATIWVLCCWSFDSFAQQAKDHLLPSDGYFTSFAHERAYYPRVREVLCAGLTDTPVAQVVVLPSFTPEYVLSLEERAAKYYLTYRICETSVWASLQDKSQPPVSVKTTTVELNPPAAQAVASAVAQAISQTHYPEPSTSRSLGFDGTTYDFSHFQLGVGLQGGQTWSPRAGTKMSDLVALVTTLQKITAVPTDAQLQTTLIQQAQKLLIRLTKG
ncbi:hypothetical protein JAO73_07575 [Hymenobacter sp. BT523]|uniref:hypothetical protein n=1 Tax=Hymenobacter sp. BT523 TaxID=2795725 RepID=UPI0018EA5DD7|nr:hypothetical protein [Hymenobacter sp. BT523]MBJ6108862.1 hypothetical protein [Hymenobacter sp. BT523]